MISKLLTICLSILFILTSSFNMSGMIDSEKIKRIKRVSEGLLKESKKKRNELISSVINRNKNKIKAEKELNRRLMIVLDLEIKKNKFKDLDKEIVEINKENKKIKKEEAEKKIKCDLKL